MAPSNESVQKGGRSVTFATHLSTTINVSTSLNAPTTVLFSGSVVYLYHYIIFSRTLSTFLDPYSYIYLAVKSQEAVEEMSIIEAMEEAHRSLVAQMETNPELEKIVEV